MNQRGQQDPESYHQDGQEEQKKPQAQRYFQAILAGTTVV